MKVGRMCSQASTVHVLLEQFNPASTNRLQHQRFALFTWYPETTSCCRQALHGVQGIEHIPQEWDTAPESRSNLSSTCKTSSRKGAAVTRKQVGVTPADGRSKRSQSIQGDRGTLRPSMERSDDPTLAKKQRVTTNRRERLTGATELGNGEGVKPSVAGR